jgi:phage FluMu gp28-like protein
MTTKPKTKPRSPAIPLCPYQERWIADQSRFKIAVKSRRIGFTFATTLEIALDSMARQTRWLIISRTQDTAREALKEIKTHFAAMRIAAGASAAISDLPTELFLDSLRVSQYVIELPNGSEIIAMTAHPDAARGFGGNVFLDEHGFHRDSEELWKGAAAAVLRGHRLIVVSTPHYQTGNFYRLARQAGLTLGHPPLTQANEAMEIGEAKEAHEKKEAEEKFPASSASSASSVPSVVKSSLWSPHWVDLHTAAPQLRAIGVPIDLDELRELAGDEETWNQEFCCQFLSAAEMWIPLDLIASARSPQATLEWNPAYESEPRPAGSGSGSLYVGADIGRKRDRTAIWIDERVADVSICRGVIILDRTPFERQYEVLSELLAHPLVRRACIDQTGIGMALVERLQEKFGSKVEGITFTAPIKEEMSLRVRRRMEERLDKIPDNAPAIERDFAAVKREVTSSGSLRFDAERTDRGHADVYWAKALADHAAGAGVAAVSLGSDSQWERSSILSRIERPAIAVADDLRPPSFWDPDRSPDREEIFA